jgi:hypothetical protein
MPRRRNTAAEYMVDDYGASSVKRPRLRVGAAAVHGTPASAGADDDSASTSTAHTSAAVAAAAPPPPTLSSSISAAAATPQARRGVRMLKPSSRLSDYVEADDGAAVSQHSMLSAGAMALSTTNASRSSMPPPPPPPMPTSAGKRARAVACDRDWVCVGARDITAVHRAAERCDGVRERRDCVPDTARRARAVRRRARADVKNAARVRTLTRCVRLTLSAVIVGLNDNVAVRDEKPSLMPWPTFASLALDVACRRCVRVLMCGAGVGNRRQQVEEEEECTERHASRQRRRC